jgi:hypothetical protein
MEECSQGNSEGCKRQARKNNNRLAGKAEAEASLRRPRPISHPKNTNGKFTSLLNELLKTARLSETQEKFFETNASKDEKAIAEGGKLRTGDICNYVKSFGHVHASWRKKGKRKRILPTLEEDFGADSNPIVELWGKPTISPLIVIPLHLKKHFAGAAVSVSKRQLVVYNSAIPYQTRSRGKVTAAVEETEAEETAVGAQNDTVEYMNELALYNENLVKMVRNEKDELVLPKEKTKPVCTAPLASKLNNIHKTIVDIEEKTNTNAYMQIKHAKGWRLHIVQSFVHQKDATSCGVFQCLFFDCVANDIPMQTGGAGGGTLNTTDLKIYRKWVAYSLAVTRIMGFAPTYNRGKKISESVTVDMTNE